MSNELYPLIEPAKHGDRDAIDAMFKHLRPVFFRYCRARLGRPFSTPDGIAEEVFVQVFAALPDYEDPPALFLKSVYQRAFAAVDEVQSQALSGIPNGPEAPPQMTQLLNRLSKLQREVTVLRIVVGLDARDTALLLDISAPGVRSAQHRAITRLRKLIEIEDVSLPA
ncbi:hypothetical protein BAY60_35940 (plasmid) [Prauserella muralis]|uniref:RNA polymerase sigma factor 70 region 4 type 2 domain-containing protein n=1 Tax=Prauserella muralis TaxID=588067 RepID=A0A2V4ADS3_9PSEU|nr:hypothetical protein BAY60_35940 [Prauserella muralis]